MSSDPLPDKSQQKRKNSTSGDQYELSGDFRGAVINIKSTIVGAAEIKDIENLPPEPGDPPFQGLQYFDEKDADRFFGREQLTARIAGRLRRSRFLAIIGASGSGKSSLVRAGVIPALRRGLRLADGGLPPKDSGHWEIQVLTPSAHPLQSLAAGLAGDSQSLAAINSLHAELAEDAHTLSLAVRQRLAKGSSPHLLLVIDQFEEIYTLCRSDDERLAFIENLLTAVDPEDEQPLTLIITLRADFYPQIAQHHELREMVSQHQEFIGAMTRDELVSAIDRPLAQGGWKIQEGLIEVILDDVGYEPGALPLLSHALLETWRRRRGGTLTLSGYTESGGIAGAIAKTAETVFRQTLSTDQQPIARMIFLRMAELGEDIQDTRRRATFDELITQSTNELVIETVINILVDARLVTTGTIEPGDTKVVELAHEALIREWPTLRTWLEQDREGLILHRQLADATNDWVRLERDPGVLYRGARLKQALDWAEKHPDLISLSEDEFLAESQKVAKEEAEQARRLARATRTQRALAVASVLLLALAGGLVYNFLIRKVPAQMDGFFNIAVAQFDQRAENSKSASATFPNEAAVRNSVFQSLQGEVKDNANVLVWTDGSELQAEHVTIGTVDGANRDEMAESAQAMAERLQADMILYGQVDESSGKPTLQISFWLASDQGYGLDDLQGNFQLGGPVPLSTPLDPSAQEAINKQASATAWTALGLTEGRLGHSLESLEAFLEAEKHLPESDMVQFFIGREYLFLVDREAVLEFAREPLEQQAELAFRKAIELNSNNIRAYTGLGSVYLKRAWRLTQDITPETAQAGGRSAPAFQAQELVEQAISAYQHALKINDAGGRYGTLEDQVVRLALGKAYLLKGEINDVLGNSAQAMALLDQTIQTVQPTLADFQSPGLKRYLAQAYDYLGQAYDWKANIFWAEEDYAESVDAYEQSAKHFEQCVAQGEGSEDLIIKEEIVGDFCTQRLNTVRQFLESLNGEQG